MNGGDTNNNLMRAGAVYQFERSSASWSKVAYFKASDTERLGRFNSVLALSGSVDVLDVLVVGAPDRKTGGVYVIRRDAGIWTFSEKLVATITDSGDEFGAAVSLSAVGLRLAIGASGEDGSGTGFTEEPTDNDASSAGAVYLFEETGGYFTQTTYIKASNTDAFDQFGAAGSLNGDGARLAISAPGEGNIADGINGDQSGNSALEMRSVSRLLVPFGPVRSPLLSKPFAITWRSTAKIPSHFDRQSRPIRSG